MSFFNGRQSIGLPVVFRLARCWRIFRISVTVQPLTGRSPVHGPGNKEALSRNRCGRLKAKQAAAAVGGLQTGNGFECTDVFFQTYFKLLKSQSEYKRRDCFMEKNIIIRNEKKEDWEVVETLTRQAFYNIYVPGCPWIRLHIQKPLRHWCLA